jgi:hypothetical protein
VSIGEDVRIPQSADGAEKNENPMNLMVGCGMQQARERVEE